MLDSDYTSQQLANIQKKLDERHKLSISIDGVHKTEVKDLASLIFYIVIESRQTKFENSKVQCRERRDRSAQDVYKIARDYGFEVSLEQIHRALNQLVEKTALFSSYCSTVRRIVYTPRYLVGITLPKVRTALGNLNIKNPEYVSKNNRVSTKTKHNRSLLRKNR